MCWVAFFSGVFGLQSFIEYRDRSCEQTWLYLCSTHWSAVLCCSVRRYFPCHDASDLSGVSCILIPLVALFSCWNLRCGKVHRAVLRTAVGPRLDSVASIEYTLWWMSWSSAHYSKRQSRSGKSSLLHSIQQNWQNAENWSGQRVHCNFYFDL